MFADKLFDNLRAESRSRVSLLLEGRLEDARPRKAVKAARRGLGVGRKKQRGRICSVEK